MASKQQIVDAVAKQLKNKDMSKQAIMVMSNSTENVLKRIKQDVDAQIKEDSSPIIETFVVNAAEKMSAMTQQWADGVKNELVIFPEGTRYIWRDGSTTTIIVEQQPQVRHINFNGQLYLLSMPYVQFILSFKDGVSTQLLRVTCTKKPISDLDQATNYLPLSNIDGQHCVCMGNFDWNKKNNMTEHVNHVIGQFWQSAFTTDRIEYCHTFLNDNNFFDSTPKKTANGFKKWEENSKNNSLFATEKTTKYTPGTTFRSFLLADANKNGSQSIVNKLKQEIVTAIGSIGGDIQALLKNTDLLAENRDKTHAETLEGVLKEIVMQAYAELHEYLQKEIQQDRVKLQKEIQEAANKLRNEFDEHMNETLKVK